MTSITLTGSAPTPIQATAARATASNDTSSAAASTTSRTTSTTGGGTPGGSFSTSIDPSLDITVLRFFSATGELTQSFPSQKQLASYQVYGLDKGGATPAAQTATGATAAAEQSTAPAVAASVTTASVGDASAHVPMAVAA